MRGETPLGFMGATPAGLTRYHGKVYPQWDGDFFVGHLTDRVLERLRIDGTVVVLQEKMLIDLQDRIRDVQVGPDNHLYILTDASDGRILRLQPGGPRADQLDRVAHKIEHHEESTVPYPNPEPGDPVKGKQAFLERCSGCHSVGAIVQGGHIGPDLAGVYGRNAGTQAGFGYSATMANSPQHWNSTSLDLFIANPSLYWPGTRMMAAPVVDAEVRRQILGFLINSQERLMNSMTTKFVVIVTAFLVGVLDVSVISADTMRCIESAPAGSLWAHSNLHVWEVANADSKKRGPDERARMLKKWGIEHYAYLSRQDPYGVEPDINTSQLDIDAEIEAMQRSGIDIRAWYFWVNTDDPAKDPNVTKTFGSFKRHHIHPQVWVPQSHAQREMAYSIFPKTPEEQQQRVNHEAERIRLLVKLAEPYGLKVDLYNHQGWFGKEENQLAILDRLKELGVTNVGLVFNFVHAMVVYSDLPRVFPQIWQRIKPYVVAVNMDVNPYYLEMMRVIEESGWKGPIGIWTENGDPEVGLRYNFIGLDWLAAELKHSG